MSEISIKNPDAEIAVLGSILIDASVMESINNILIPESFYTTKHKKIFSTMIDMHNKGTPIDLVTLSSSLKENDLYEDVGGYNYLIYLTELTPVSANAKHYAGIVRRLSEKRVLINSLDKIIADIKNDSGDCQQALSDLLDFNVNTSESSDLVPVSAKDLNINVEPVQSLWGELLYPECITQINSEPAVGKTTFFYNVCLKGSIGEKFLGLEFSKKLKTLYLDVETPSWKRVAKLKMIFDAELPKNLYFLDYMNLKTDFSKLLKLCKKERYDLIVFDTQSRTLNMEQENDNAEANRVLDLLRRLARNTGSAIALIHHTGKSNTEGVYSGRGASAIAGGVDVVANMESVDEEIIKFTVPKNKIMGGYKKFYIKKLGGDQFSAYTPSGEIDTVFEKFKAQDYIIGLLQDGDVWVTADIQEDSQKAGFTKSTISRGIGDLHEAGKIQRVEHGRYKIHPKSQNLKNISQPKNNEILRFSKATPQEMPTQPDI